MQFYPTTPRSNQTSANADLSLLSLNNAGPTSKACEVVLRNLSKASQLLRFNVQEANAEAQSLVAEVCGLSRACFEAPMPATRLALLLISGISGSREGGGMFGIRSEGRLAAVLGFVPDAARAPEGKQELHIEILATHPDFRRRGFGLLLMQEVISIARASEHYAAISLEVLETNHAARQLYEDRLGFEVAGRASDFYGTDKHGLRLLLRM